MNFVPAGFNNSSDEEDFIDFSHNEKVYDRDSEGVNSEDGEHGMESEEVDNYLGDFMNIVKVKNCVFVKGDKIRLFTDFKNAIFVENTTIIEDFCYNVPDWHMKADETGLTGLDYAIAYAKDISLTTILQHTHPSSIDTPVGMLWTMINDEADDKNTDIQKCVQVLHSHGYTNISITPPIPKTSRVYAEHAMIKPSEISCEHTNLLSLFLRDIHLSILLSSFHNITFKQFLLMQKEDFIKLGISQPGIISRLSDTICDFHQFPWKPQVLLDNESLFKMSGSQVAGMFRNMAEHMSLIDVSLEYARRRAEKQPSESNQGWRYQLMQLSQSRSVLVTELEEFKEKFDGLHSARRSLQSSRNKANNRSLLNIIICAIAPVITIIFFVKFKK